MIVVEGADGVSECIVSRQVLEKINCGESEKLGRLPSAGQWIVTTLLVAVLVICLLGSMIGLMAK